MTEALLWLFEGTVEDGLFAAPGFLGLLVVVPVLAGVLWFTGWRHERRLRRLFRGPVAEQIRPRGVRFRRTLRDVLLLVALTLGIIALAGPRFDKQVQLVKARGVDLVLVVDLSRSMDAADVDPSRLERARREILDLIDLLEGDRVGLVIFAGGAYGRMPLSLDHNALRMLVEEMSTRDFQAQGSALGEAIGIGTTLLTRDETSTAGKALVVLSDGELHNPTAAFTAAAEARDQGVRIYAMGIGEAAAPIPLGNGNWQEDRSGRQVLTTPSPDMLREVARIGGGAYVDSTPSNADMRRLYRDEIRGTLEAGLRDVRPKVKWRDGWGWPLGIGIVCALLAAWLGEGTRRWGAAAAVVLAVTLAAGSPAEAASLAEGDQAYRDGRYPDAVRIFTELAYDRPTDAELQRRLGAARYRAGDFEGAARAFERQAELEGDARDALFDAGNAHARAGRLEEAIDRYDRVLERGPHEGAAKNREVVAGELERRRAEQPPPQQQQQQQGGEEGEDGEQGEQGEQGEPGQGESQPAGEQGEQGEPEDQDGDQQGGDPEEGEESSGTSQGDPEQGDQAQSGDNPTQMDGGQKQAGDDQTRRDESDLDGVSPDELDQDGEGGATAVGEVEEGEVDDPNAIAAKQAEKLLDGVQEGRPRVTIPGGSEDKPW